ncbi:(2Fe-2S)-binding protein [Aeoliella sp. ICT_H6.2]|uniref:(2Fe-2S)-binding protein n=1 Tax=Aeoliella straminimaris TaxID=2954799 RepID=A0A9X2F873_9BACT|nr:(2Fe-2S)-binding protein [Aeoliella straminimaris]MCO6044147.1 (2Fe-2S)-binding protein [Aeoliella straminimaris]
MPDRFSLEVNGQAHSVETDAQRPLLDVLREELSLTGTKYGCGEGACGACTVIVDGEATRSCITSIAEVDGRRVETIEGLASGVELHRVQQAFIDQSAMQCGYCVPGQIMNAVALLRTEPQATGEQIVEAMDGNLCRCCNYRNLRAAVEQAAGR